MSSLQKRLHETHRTPPGKHAKMAAGKRIATRNEGDVRNNTDQPLPHRWPIAQFAVIALYRGTFPQDLFKYALRAPGHIVTVGFFPPNRPGFEMAVIVRDQLQAAFEADDTVTTLF